MDELTEQQDREQVQKEYAHLHDGRGPLNARAVLLSEVAKDVEARYIAPQPALAALFFATAAHAEAGGLPLIIIVATKVERCGASHGVARRLDRPQLFIFMFTLLKLLYFARGASIFAEL